MYTRCWTACCNFRWRRALLSLACIVMVTGGSTPSFADHQLTQAMPIRQSDRCSLTSYALVRACRNEIQDDFWEEVAKCQNEPDAADRADCIQDAREERREAADECSDQFEAREEVCELLGQGAYDPDFSPASFVDPDDIGDTIPPNPYLPLVPGTQWVYEGDGEMITVLVSNKVKLIEGVLCRVVNDVVREDGVVIEDTDDWFAQHQNGDVWYCGEEAKDFETFAGDDPEEPELVSIEGSFKAGREGAKPGILVRAAPQVGDAYRQEFALGDAEDVAEVISITGTESVPAASCDNTCIVTRDFTSLEPDVTENKYYAPGIGVILEVDMEGNRVELVDFSMP